MDKQLYKGIIQGITGEQGFPRRFTEAQEEVYYRLGELVADTMITETEMHECWQQYTDNLQKPSVPVNLAISRRFYE